jgi:uncharacterized protein (TIGR00255 family)
MTGHGEAHQHRGGLAVSVEVRTVNSRYFKLISRAGDAYSALEPRIEAVVRRHVRRGAVQVDVRIDREPTPDDYRLNDVVLASYQRQLERLREERPQGGNPIRLEALLSLPGVVDERLGSGVDVEAAWPHVEGVLVEALRNMSRMRSEEGRAMAADLQANRRAIARELDEIEKRAPAVADAYRDRLTERLNRLLAQYEVQAETADVLREVGLFAERSDISEEIVRLRSHLEQFDVIVELQESSGRKLDFLTQEMFRETNTIGSKANDAEIARHVIEIKAAIERMREMAQNAE